jgi:16S rRNA processing protein RimM
MRFIPVGRVLTSHGLGGEVKFKYYNEAAASPQYSSLYVDRDGVDVELRLSRIRRHGNIFIIKFRGLETVDDVGFLLKKELAVAEGDLPALDENEYYDYQLIGLKVVTDKGSVLGKVKYVMHIRTSDVLVIDSLGTQASDRQFIEGLKASECVALSREAPLAPPVEGLLKPNNCATQAPLIAGNKEILIPMTEDHIDRINREEGFILVREEALVE